MEVLVFMIPIALFLGTTGLSPSLGPAQPGNMTISRVPNTACSGRLKHARTAARARVGAPETRRGLGA